MDLRKVAEILAYGCEHFTARLFTRGSIQRKPLDELESDHDRQTRLTVESERSAQARLRNSLHGDLHSDQIGGSKPGCRPGKGVDGADIGRDRGPGGEDEAGKDERRHSSILPVSRVPQG